MFSKLNICILRDETNLWVFCLLLTRHRRHGHSKYCRSQLNQQKMIQVLSETATNLFNFRKNLEHNKGVKFTHRCTSWSASIIAILTKCPVCPLTKKQSGQITCSASGHGDVTVSPHGLSWIISAGISSSKEAAL